MARITSYHRRYLPADSTDRAAAYRLGTTADVSGTRDVQGGLPQSSLLADTARSTYGINDRHLSPDGSPGLLPRIVMRVA